MDPAIGLALSGGGFRATLFHLGVIRQLRATGLLPLVRHICSVSGGSVIAAHLALNWDRYTGPDTDFDDAASELIAFTKRDVRGRTVRRWVLSGLVFVPLLAMKLPLVRGFLLAQRWTLSSLLVRRHSWRRRKRPLYEG